MLLVQVRGKMAVLPAVTAVLLHHSSACRYCSTVTSQFCLQLLQYCHITILPAVTAVLLHHSSACSYCSTVTSHFCLQLLQYCYITVLPAVTAGLLHHSSACSYCSTVTCHNNNLSSSLYQNAVQYFPYHSPLKKYIYLP